MVIVHTMPTLLEMFAQAFVWGILLFVFLYVMAKAFLNEMENDKKEKRDEWKK